MEKLIFFKDNILDFKANMLEYNCVTMEFNEKNTGFYLVPRKIGETKLNLDKKLIYIPIGFNPSKIVTKFGAQFKHSFIDTGFGIYVNIYNIRSLKPVPRIVHAKDEKTKEITSSTVDKLSVNFKDGSCWTSQDEVYHKYFLTRLQDLISAVNSKDQLKH